MRIAFLNLRNVLFERCDTSASGFDIVNAEQVTANVTTFAYCDTLNLDQLHHRGRPRSATALNPTARPSIQAAPCSNLRAGGNYYLTNGSPYRNAGTTNISPALIAELRQKTTYPAMAYTNAAFYSPTNFSPQAQRDTDARGLGLSL